MYLGIEIGGTKLQLGIGTGDGNLLALWRGAVDVQAGGEGIREQILSAIPELLNQAGINKKQLQAAGVGFGGPVDDAARRVIKSHHIKGWDDFPVSDWLGDSLNLPVAIGNDADVAGLAEALFGAGQGMSPIFYITVGSGIGGGLIIDGEIYRGIGRGAGEIGHLRLSPLVTVSQSNNEPSDQILEYYASGWGIERAARSYLARHRDDPDVAEVIAKIGGEPSAQEISALAADENELAQTILNQAWHQLAKAVCHVIALLCPRRIIIGGGVSLMGEELLFRPLRRMVADRVFQPFAGCCDIIPAALQEEVVVHGAVALAQKRFSKQDGKL